jgi:hypothetical protein
LEGAIADNQQTTEERGITRILPIVGLDVGAIGSTSLSALGRAGHLLFGFLFLSSSEVFQLNFGCQAEVFQFPHHRQYLFVSGKRNGHLHKTTD